VDGTLTVILNGKEWPVILDTATCEIAAAMTRKIYARCRSVPSQAADCPPA